MTWSPPPLPSALFRPGPLSCPGCWRSVADEAPDRCPHCGYTAWTCLERFPFAPPPLERILDSEQRLTSREQSAVAKAFDRVEAQFPQVRLHVCLARLHEGCDCREFAFWLMNASVPRTEDEAALRPWSLLLVIDRQSRTAALSVGYSLDSFLSDRILEEALAAAFRNFKTGDYVKGITAVANRLCRSLHLACRQAAGAVARARNAPLLSESARRDASKSSRRAAW